MATAPLGGSHLDFLLAVGRIKQTVRTGWAVRGIVPCESVGDHMYQMGLMALTLCPPDLDRDRCMRLCLVHDLAECVTSDLLPEEHGGPKKADKHVLEQQAMVSLVSALPSTASAIGEELLALWAEYEAGESAEARFVKDLDKLEMCIQALAYERQRPDLDLSDFFRSLDRLHTPTCVALGEELRGRRTHGVGPASASSATASAAAPAAAPAPEATPLPMAPHPHSPGGPGAP